MFQNKAIRLVTYTEELILCTKDEQHAQAILNHIIGCRPLIAPKNEEIMNLKYFQDLWVAGTFSNGDYLLYLNFMGNRSFNDLTQYPVFPWIISDYKSTSGASKYRDLTKPVGALNNDKLEQFRSKYFEIVNKATSS
jgi:Beige/BEACH domain